MLRIGETVKPNWIFDQDTLQLSSGDIKPPRKSSNNRS